MTAMRATAILSQQEKNLRKLNNLRFVKGGYEYKLAYEGGISCYFSIHRRQVGKRNFKYYTGFGAWKCWTAKEALNDINLLISYKEEPWLKQAKEDAKKRELEFRKLDGLRFVRYGTEYKFVYSGGLLCTVSLLCRKPGHGWRYFDSFNGADVEEIFDEVFKRFGGAKL